MTMTPSIGNIVPHAIVKDLLLSLNIQLATCGSSFNPICSSPLHYPSLKHKDNTIQIHNNVLWDWQDFMKYSQLFSTFKFPEIFHEIMLVLQNIVMDMNNVMSMLTLISHSQTPFTIRLNRYWIKYLGSSIKIVKEL